MRDEKGGGGIMDGVLGRVRVGEGKGRGEVMIRVVGRVLGVGFLGLLFAFFAFLLFVF